MLLEGKTAVIYGAGAIGGAVARAFAREGARVFLASRTREHLEELANDIRAAGGVAETAVVDALDERAVNEHADAVAAQGGAIDISFNLISHGDVQGTPLAEMSLPDFMQPRFRHRSGRSRSSCAAPSKRVTRRAASRRAPTTSSSRSTTSSTSRTTGRPSSPTCGASAVTSMR